jgi:hypothetical protein
VSRARDGSLGTVLVLKEGYHREASGATAAHGTQGRDRPDPYCYQRYRGGI